MMENEGARLIKNCLETPDGTILQSRHRHDYKAYTDANGKEYMIDGGLSYVRSSAHGDEIHHCVWDDEPFNKVREALEWGTYGINGDQPLTYVKLCDMSTDHIQAIMGSIPSLLPQFKKAMNLELELREIKEEYE